MRYASPVRRHTPLTAASERSRRRRVGRRRRPGRNHTLHRIESAISPRPAPGGTRPPAFRARRRHAVLLAGRHVVEESVQADDVGRFSGTDGGPQGERVLASSRLSADRIRTKGRSSHVGRTKRESRTKPGISAASIRPISSLRIDGFGIWLPQGSCRRSWADGDGATAMA